MGNLIIKIHSGSVEIKANSKLFQNELVQMREFGKNAIELFKKLNPPYSTYCPYPGTNGANRWLQEQAQETQALGNNIQGYLNLLRGKIFELESQALTMLPRNYHYVNVVDDALHCYRNTLSECDIPWQELNNLWDRFTNSLSTLGDDTIIYLAPTLESVLANEISCARFSAEVKSANRTFFNLVEKSINLYQITKKKYFESVLKTLETGFERADKEAAQAMDKQVTINGSAANKTWWKEWQANPNKVGKYVNIIEKEASTEGILELADNFEISRKKIQDECLNRLFSIYNPENFKKDNRFLAFCSNFSDLFGMPKENIFQNLENRYLKKQKEGLRKKQEETRKKNIDELTKYHFHTPQRMINDMKGDVNTKEYARKKINDIMSRNDFEIAVNNDGAFKREICRELRLNITFSSTQIYESIIDLLTTRLDKVKGVHLEYIGKIKQLEAEKDSLQNQLSKIMFFAFLKKKDLTNQLVKTESEIQNTQETYQRALKLYQ